MKKKVSIITLGCKVSQYESDAIAKEFENLGYETHSHLLDADYYVVNTCAVTNEAERKSRNYISKILSTNKDAKIIVCGCASEHNREQFLSNQNVIFVFGNNKKSTISKLIQDFENEKDKKENLSRDKFEKLGLTYENFSVIPNGRTRAYLKIQDGCNNFCSYCLIPFVRGRSRSRDLCEITKEAEILAQNNKEIVLTGINMSDYRIDNELSLGKVLQSLSNVEARIRIGSLEVNIIDDEFLSILKAMPNFCPQFHLSMQSGCDRILTLMNRHYSKDKYLQKIELIKKYFPDAVITTDVIVGFPTETEEDFNETIDTIKKAKFYKMHIFPYSLREGTKASRMTQVNGKIKHERVKILEKINDELHNEYLNKMFNKTQMVLTEEIDDDYVIGYTENYIRMYLPKDTPLQSLIKVKIKEQFKDGAKGEII
ncbi:MAG: tRNA (N(6)-L-threonylcarbamoyladenosine(37)-C(2))-methylthiotransferase MtaB [Clostridiales bacterium]|nr:tRNA (N(6)-L-threonylcarbamoyladenosine(37)-C(2))-methylthiotransferase MtaB [Candidatus Apopatousia equi]